MFHENHCFINSGNRALPATCIVPERYHASLLFILPVAEERKGALPVYLQLARQIAPAGIASLIFDLSGNGDAPGAFDDFTPTDWEQDCMAAWQWLTTHYPAPAHYILGLRYGALLATRLTAHCANLQGLVLWSPITGNALVRQLLQRHIVNEMIAYGQSRSSRAALIQNWEQGASCDLDGYLFTAAQYRGLNTLPPRSHHTPTFLCAGGVTATDFIPEAQTHALELRFPPFWNSVGHVDVSELIAATATWLQAPTTPPASALSPSPSPTLCTSVEHSNMRTTLATRAGLSYLHQTPHTTPRAGVLFLHGWSGDRTGPHRLFTQFSRSLIALGYHTLRFDFYGRGLSQGDAGEASIARMVSDGQAALNELRQELPPHTPLSIVAICSGCKVALTLAANNPEIARLTLWSPESMGNLRSARTGMRKTRQNLITYAVKLTRLETWRKLFRGQIQTDMVAKALTRHETRTPAEAQWEDQVLKKLRTFRNPIDCIFGSSDPDAAGSRQAYTKFFRQNHIPATFHTIEHAGHSFYGSEWSAELFEHSLAPLRAPDSPLNP